MLLKEEAEELLIDKGVGDNFVAETFKGLYYTDDENHTIDILRGNIWALKNEYKQAIAMTALIRAWINRLD